MQATPQHTPGMSGQAHLSTEREPSDFAIKLGAIIELVDGKTDYTFGNDGHHECLDITTKASKFEKIMRAFGATYLSPVLGVILSEDQVVAFITHPRTGNIKEWVDKGDGPIGIAITMVNKQQLQGWSHGMMYAGYPGGMRSHPAVSGNIFAQPIRERYLNLDEAKHNHFHGREPAPETKVSNEYGSVAVSAKVDESESLKQD